MKNLKLSKLAENLTSHSISKLSEKIDEKRQQGEKIYNFTLGDFSPQHFPIPHGLEAEIIAAYREKQTNYPYVGGMEELRIAIADHIKSRGQFDYEPDEIIVASGARPLIHHLFRTIVDPGEKIIYTAPSWNTQHFIYLCNAEPIIIQAKSENNFMVTAEELKTHLKEAVIITINSPLNPSGTTFDPQTLKEIFDLVVTENNIRAKHNQKPIYIFFDIIYWLLTYNDIKCNNPILLNPEIRDYVIFIDGISKCFAATGVRLGWAFGPRPIISKMRSMLAHTGAWAPKPEQIATAKYLQKYDEVTDFLDNFKNEILARLNIFYAAIQKLKAAGYNIDAIEPQGAIYLSVKIDLIGAKTKNSKILKTVDDISTYLLEDAKVALVPFYFFGMDESLPWFRLSVGTCSIDDAKIAADNIIQSIQKLTRLS
ncbi:MAG TPA: aminotransferase [Coxiellaceae bacterium]|nr:MAG: aminotransferase [Gammaproteobacteria bacterium RBG_16_37_9]HBS51808.1 aminotransferase [Coxiellaceae bacterium]HBY55904.1 aminotransferase [Coxiellaceae bacterium]